MLCWVAVRVKRDKACPGAWLKVRLRAHEQPRLLLGSHRPYYPALWNLDPSGSEVPQASREDEITHQRLPWTSEEQLSEA